MTSHDFFHDFFICNYQRSLTKLGGEAVKPQVTQTALDDVQMSVKRCAIEVLGKLNLPPEDRFGGMKIYQNDVLWSVTWKKSCITWIHPATPKGLLAN